MTEPSNSNAQRDAATLRILGWFFVALAALVLAGSLWTLDNHRALVVNLASGFVLGGVGVGMVFASRRLNAKVNGTDSG